MAEFSNLITTEKGQALLNKVAANECSLVFTKVVTSEEIYTIEQLEGLTAIDAKQSVIVSRVYTESSQVNIEASFNNLLLSDGYYLRNIGLYAMDPTKGEILFAVAKETSESCYMPAYNNLTTSGISLKLILNNSNTDYVSVNASPAAVATSSEVAELRANLQYALSTSSVITELLQHIRALSVRIDALESANA